MSGHYLIELGFKPGKKLTMAQRTSSMFAEEPVVNGRVLRRRSKPMKLTPEQWKAEEVYLLQLAAAGAIKVTEPDKTSLTPEEIKAAQAAIEAQHALDAEKEKAALAGDQTTAAPAGEEPPAGAVTPEAPVEPPAPETTEVVAAPPAPEVVPEEESGKVEEPVKSEPSHEAPKKRRR